MSSPGHRFGRARRNALVIVCVDERKQERHPGSFPQGYRTSSRRRVAALLAAQSGDTFCQFGRRLPVQRRDVVSRMAWAAPCTCTCNMRCEWCGCETDGANHRSLGECVKALQREVEFLRQELAKRNGVKKDEPNRPWKMRR